MVVIGIVGILGRCLSIIYALQFCIVPGLGLIFEEYKGSWVAPIVIMVYWQCYVHVV